MAFRSCRSTSQWVTAVALTLVLVGLATSCRKDSGVGNVKNLKAVRVQFGWLPDSHHAGFWIAKDKGYYEAEGLSVELTPGGLDSSPLKSVVSGAADIGQAGGIEQLVSARAEGLPVRAIAAFHRVSPQALISLDRSPVRAASDLRGKRVAVAYGDAAELLFREFISRNGIPDDAMTLVPFRFDLTPLMDDKVDVVTGFSTDQPATLKAKGFAPVVLRYSDVGIRSYGYTFFCAEDYVAQHPDICDRFIRASRRGWEYAFAHKDEAIALMKKHFPTLDASVEGTKFEDVRALMCDGDGHLSQWDMNTAMISDAISRLRQYGGLKKDILQDSITAKEYVER